MVIGEGGNLGTRHLLERVWRLGIVPISGGLD